MKKISIKLIAEDGSYVNAYHNIDYVNFGDLDRGSTSEVLDWGIYSNRGEVSFFDIDGEAEYLLRANVEKQIKVEIYLSSELFDKKVATFYVEDYEYDSNTQKISIRLQDSLQKWQMVEQDEIYLFETQSALDFLQTVWTSARNKHNFLQEFTLKFGNADTILQLNFCNIDCPHLQANNLWGNMDKICQITMCRICVDADGNPTIFYDGANTKKTVIRPNNIISIDAESSRENNKVSLPTITVKDRTKHINEEVAFVSYKIYDYTTTPQLVTIGDRQVVTNIINWGFVGGDKTLNPNVSATEVQMNEYIKMAMISFDAPVVSNTHAVTGHNTFATLYDETDPSTVWENQDREQDEISWYLDKKSGKAHVEFGLPNAFYSGRQVISTARTSVKGNFYTDAADKKFYTSAPNDVTYALAPTEITSNELLQEKNTYKNPYAPEEGDLSTPLYLQILEEVSRKYGNGLEGCEIECTFGDYYTENGEKVIDGSGINAPIQGFSRYDIVTPYIQKGYKTIPYKLDDNGNPMSFKVIGIKYNYNGVLRQTLCLQEYVS